MSEKALIMIPARLDSKRLPNKPLLEAGGKPLIWHTYQQAIKTSYPAMIVTPDEAILDSCLKHSIPCVIIQGDFDSGTARCAVALDHGDCSEFDYIVNWQCDEPFANPDSVVEAVKAIRPNSSLTIGTLVSMITRKESDVSVAFENSRCYWFSRAALIGGQSHIGVYVFTRASLQHAASRICTKLRFWEELEQLSWIQADMDIVGVESVRHPVDISINTHEDFEAFKKHIESASP